VAGVDVGPPSSVVCRASSARPVRSVVAAFVLIFAGAVYATVRRPELEVSR
jgi:hypothetical protein